MPFLETALSATQTIIAALQYLQLKEMYSDFEYSTKLKDLQSAVLTIKAVLLDADSKHELSHRAQLRIEELRDVVYDADDLFDEFLTRKEQGQSTGGGGFSDQVTHYLSRLEALVLDCTMSNKVEEIRRELDAIGRNHSQFGFTVGHQPTKWRREETCSYVHVHSVIGREDDTKRIVDMLVDPSVSDVVSVLSIVGMGGLGKTTLAKVVYNEPRIQKEFPLRLWVCVADQGEKQLNVRAILSNILKADTDVEHIDDIALDQLQKKVRSKLGSRKYLLVLDDVWTEDHGEWLKLEEFLMGLGHKGNRVVVTTRSKRTAIAVRSHITHELKALSEKHSWQLFEMIVGTEQANCCGLVDIGRRIVKKCGNVPMAIKVMGSLLYGQDKNKWLSFDRCRLTEIRKGENNIVPILKLSYHHLSPPLKSCFSYCAMFPEDFVFYKEVLISHWIAHGYIEPLDGGHSIEDAAEEYFLILVHRCFFQDFEKDEYGEIISCKIHGLMRDIAQEVAGECIYITNSNKNRPGTKIRHMYIGSNTCMEGFTIRCKIRSLISNSFMGNLNLEKGLRVLDMSNAHIEVLTDGIGELLHLRYLDLSGNSKLYKLPDAVTNLVNLETLILRHCMSLKELPRGFDKLVKLRVLDVYVDLNHRGFGLRRMPSGLGKCTCLSRLTMFVLAEGNSSFAGNLEDLRALSKLKGDLTIRINNSYRYVKNSGHGGYLSSNDYLNDICIGWELDPQNMERTDCKDLLEDLQPHPNLRGLTIWRYQGSNIPSWASNLETSLPNLVKIVLYGCDGLQSWPCLEKLHYLRTLKIWDMQSLEYMGDRSGAYIRGSGVAASNATVFFPCLEELELSNLRKFEGWWKTSGSGSSDVANQLGDRTLPSFPRLSKLTIKTCPCLTSVPRCPKLQTLALSVINEQLQIEAGDYENVRHPAIKILETDDVDHHFKSPFAAAFQHLTQLEISDKNLVSFSDVENWLVDSWSSSLRTLILHDCDKLRSGLEHFTALESLMITKSASSTSAEVVPEGLGALSSLQSLLIKNYNLESLPETFMNLTSLKRLEILNCSIALEESCKRHGEDWPKIQHIPCIHIKSSN